MNAVQLAYWEGVFRSALTSLPRKKVVSLYSKGRLDFLEKFVEEFHEVINIIKEKFDNLIRTYEILFAYRELKYSFMADSLVGVMVQKGKKSKLHPL